MFVAEPMPMMRALRLGFGVAWLILAGMSSDAWACMCPTHPACAAYWRADAVFVGRVTGSELRHTPREPSMDVHVSVGRVFRGLLAGDVILRQYHTDCSYSFRHGETYLVFANRDVNGEFSASICSGTKPLGEAAADIRVVEALPSLAPFGRVYGDVTRWLRSPVTGMGTSEAAAGVAIELASAATRFGAITDAAGHFELARIPPGTYTVAPLVPDTIHLSTRRLEIDVAPRSCVALAFSLGSNGRVSGRLQRSDRAPAASVAVELRAADGQNDSSGELERYVTLSSAEGRFAFKGILPGRYHLGVNTRYGPDPRAAPYAPRYYPDATDPASAYVIDLGEGEQKTGFDFVLTTLTELEVREIVESARRSQPPRVAAPSAPPPISLYPEGPIFRRPFLSLPDARRPGG